MNYLIFNITNFHQELKGLSMNQDQIGLFIQHQLVISKIDTCDESSYFTLPKELRHQMKRLID